MKLELGNAPYFEANDTPDVTTTCSKARSGTPGRKSKIDEANID
jgi:hypothetical protein